MDTTLERARVGAVFLMLFILSLILMVSGTQGSFGRLLCVVFAPGRLAIRDHTERSGLIHTIVSSVTPQQSSGA